MFGGIKNEILYEKLLREKDARILYVLREKDARILKKNVTLLVALVVLVVVTVLMWKLMQNTVVEKERQLVRAEATLARTRARFQAEWNLRPVLETQVTEFLVSKGQTVPGGGQAKLDAYRNYSKDFRHFENHVKDAMSAGGIPPNRRNSVNRELETLFATLSKKNHHGDPADDVVGFVVNHNKCFSAAVSAFLRSCSLEHTVLNSEYKKVYSWPPS